MAEIMLKLSGINKYFGSQRILTGIDLEVMKGDVLGIVGPNGSGKSTLLKIVHGLVYPVESESSVFVGSNITIGALLDKPGFFPGFCLEKNLVLFSGARRTAQFDAITERLGLKPWLKKKFRNCSTGVQKRTELAAALMADPRLLVLDEPLSGLDPAGVYVLRAIIRELQEGQGAVLLADHSLLEMEKICTRICFLKQGIIREVATMGELTRRFDSLEEAYRFFNLKIS